MMENITSYSVLIIITGKNRQWKRSKIPTSLTSGWQSQYYSKKGCDVMGMCCERRTIIGWI